MEPTLKKIFNAVLEGDQETVLAEVAAALEAGQTPEAILRDGLIAAMSEVGKRFEAGDYFVPEMLIAARAMQAGLKLLKPRLAASGVRATGKALLGTVAGDLHDIGKNLVAMMLEGAGFEIVDLGADISPEAFVAAVRQHKPDMIGLSALLTTTMPNMEATLKALEKAGVRDQVKVLIGGAPVTAEYAQKIGADGFAPDASSAVKVALDVIGKK